MRKEGYFSNNWKISFFFESKSSQVFYIFQKYFFSKKIFKCFFSDRRFKNCFFFFSISFFKKFVFLSSFLRNSIETLEQLFFEKNIQNAKLTNKVQDFLLKNGTLFIFFQTKCILFEKEYKKEFSKTFSMRFRNNWFFLVFHNLLEFAILLTFSFF